jgi:hypothetical protein
MPTCPKCGSKRVERYTDHGLSCDSCGHDGRTDEFPDPKCHCAEPHPLPVWHCPVHGDVVVDAG